MLLLYSAKIASAIARGRGVSQQLDFPETAKAMSFNLDLEYNFGDVAVIMVGGSGKMTMREATTTILRDVRKLGYEPLNMHETRQIIRLPATPNLKR